MPVMSSSLSSSSPPPPMLAGGRKNRRNGNNGNGNNNDRDDMGRFKKKNGKNGDKNGQNKGQACGWINVRDLDKITDEEKFKRVEAVNKWYERFVGGIPKDLVKELTDDPSAKLVAWEVQSVVAQLKNVYLRAEEYLKTSEAEKSKLKSSNPKPGLRDGETDIPFIENNPRVEQLFRIDKLKYSNLNLLSILSGINNEKLRTFAERWTQSDPNFRTQKLTPHFVGIDYCPLYDVFYAHYGYEGTLTPVVSVQFKLSPKTGNINDREDCNGYTYQKVQTDTAHLLITIVSPIADGDNLWSLFRARPITQRRPKSYSPGSSSINDPLGPSYFGGKEKAKKPKKTKKPITSKTC